MSVLTPGQCAQLSFLAAVDQTDTHYVQWRAIHGDRHDLQWRVVERQYVTNWTTLLWSIGWERFAERIKAAGQYWDGALVVQDVLNKGGNT